ncbi:TonB-dependent receptor [Uliginosibacterium sp. 31-12]|nr:TonB-dependent receptor [Uliginosibacterium sp. 31-12]PLK49254.1 TonB-dependent receptor [Uliginosibacterium sp. TH139]
MPIIRRMRVTTLLILTLPAWLHAGPGAASEAPYFEELPTVLTASRLPQPLNEAPGAVTVLDREFIKATGYRDIGRLFRLVPGMQVGQERATTQWVTYHGLSSTYPSEMQVLIDGRSVYSPAAFGGVDWSTLPITIDDIERIEVVRGSNPVTYGANAFLGVINIITRHSDEAPGGHVAINGGYPGLLDIAAGGNGKLGDMSLRVNAQRQRDSGFANVNDSREVNILSLRGDYRISAIDELSVRLAGSDADKGAGYPDSVNSNNALRDIRSQSYTFHTEWSHAPKAGEELLLHYYRNQERIAERWNARGADSPYFPGGPVVPVDLDRRAVRDHVELQQRLSPTGNTQTVWGLEVRRDEVDAHYLYAGDESVVTQMGRLFGNAEWKFRPGWQLTGGAALEQYEHEPAHVAPRLFLNWQASASDTLRAGAARAWTQRPTFETSGDVRATEQNTGLLIQHPYVPNPDLRQAQVDSVELGYLGRFKPMASSLDVRLYRERVRGFIYRQAAVSPLSPVLNTYTDSAQYVNAANPVTLTGIEYQFKFSPWREGNWIFNHSMVRMDADEALQHRVSPYTASLSWQQGWGAGWSSMISAFRMGPLAGGDGMVPIYSYVAKAYNTFDARIAYATRIGGRKYEFSLNAINIGERHQEVADRSQQSLQGQCPANRVSAVGYLGLAVEL